MTVVSPAFVALVGNIDGRSTGDISLGRDTLPVSFNRAASERLLRGCSCVTSRPCSNQSFELLITLLVGDIELSLWLEEPESCRAVPLTPIKDLTESCEPYPLSALLNDLETIDSRREPSDGDEDSYAAGEAAVRSRCVFV
jgi:hypothetical protein